MIRVKICGINSIDAMDAAVAGGADWVGFVFAPSPRRVNADEAEALACRGAGGPRRVGLFVDPTDEEIEAALEGVPFDALQLYAPTERIAEVARDFGIDVWQALAVATADDLPAPGGPAAAYVLDARPPAGSIRAGGHGAPFDWSVCRGWQPDRPWLLAGGLTPENVVDAIGQSGAVAVDVSSGVESAAGVKDPVRIAAFIRAARAAP